MGLLTQDVAPKQPTETVAYGGDWRLRLARFPAVIISQSTWAAVTTDGALVLSGGAIDSSGKQTSVLISGGTAGYVYTVKNTVTLSDGQVWHGYGVLEIATEAQLLRT